MTPVELLQEKFQATGSASVAEWMRQREVGLSLQACTMVLLRGTDMGLITMLTLGAELDCTPEEMRWIAQQKGDKSLWRLISPDAISKFDRELLDEFHALSDEKKKLVRGMIKQMQ